MQQSVKVTASLNVTFNWRSSETLQSSRSSRLPIHCSSLDPDERRVRHHDAHPGGAQSLVSGWPCSQRITVPGNAAGYTGERTWAGRPDAPWPARVKTCPREQRPSSGSRTCQSPEPGQGRSETKVSEEPARTVAWGSRQGMGHLGKTPVTVPGGWPASSGDGTPT